MLQLLQLPAFHHLLLNVHTIFGALLEHYGSDSRNARSSNNEPLSEPQALHIQQILDDTLTALGVAEKEMSTVLLSLLRLKNEWRRRSEYAATLKGVLSPIRRVPHEILAEILLMCRDDALDAFSYSVADPRQAPILLGHVSSRWRQFSHSTPPRQSRLQMRGSVVRTGLADEDVLDLLFQQHHRLKDVRLDFMSIDLSLRTFNQRPLPILSSIQIVADEDIDITHLLTSFTDVPPFASTLSPRRT
ncbi:hypothetical protein FB451DRAFT_1398187 [Mycena latifolia]|nr:hypothetical protein FB451DRAFT_1398187 [Mycena latifolia]